MIRRPNIIPAKTSVLHKRHKRDKTRIVEKTYGFGKIEGACDYLEKSHLKLSALVADL